MLEHVHWLGHDSFRIDGSTTVYIDPWKLAAGQPPAAGDPRHARPLRPSEPGRHRRDRRRRGTSSSARPAVTAKCGGSRRRPSSPETDTVEAAHRHRAVPAYNINKFKAPGKVYHPRADGHVGYVVDMDGLRIYHAGDTDAIPEMDEHRRSTSRCCRSAAPTR